MGIHAKFELTNRAAIEVEIERLIALLDAADGDWDLEDDDPAGGDIDEKGEFPSSNGGDLSPVLPIYAVDQTQGPINEREAHRVWLEEQRRAS